MFAIKKHFFGLPFYIGWENLHYVLKTEHDLRREPHFAFLKKGKRVWDIGASLGFFSVWAAKRMNSPHVMAFELSPRAARLLQRTVDTNDLNDLVTVVARPLTCEQTLYRKPLHGHQSNRLMAGSDISVDLRQALYDYGKPEVIKMDIEGGENEFLKNRHFLDLLNEAKPDLFIECHNPEAEALCASLGLVSDAVFPNHFRTRLCGHS